MTKRSHMTVIKDLIGQEQLELFALELGKLVAFVLSNIYKYSSVKMYMTVRFLVSLIMDQIGPDWSVTYPLQ